MSEPTSLVPKSRRQSTNRLVIVLSAMLLLLLGGIATSATLYIKRENIVTTITQSGSENFTWAFNQLRVEYYRLSSTAERVAMQISIGKAPDASVWESELRKRFELFASRVEIVGKGVYSREMMNDEIYGATMAAARSFVDHIDQLLAGGAVFNQAALDYLTQPNNLEFAQRLDRLTARAVEVDSLRLVKLRDDLQNLRAFEFSNLTFKLCLLIGFGGVAIFGLIRLDRQRRSLEQVADDLRLARLSAEQASVAEHLALSRALAEEQRTGHLQRRFVSMASHEFRTPLAIIDSAAQRRLRKVGQLTPEQLRERIQSIRNTVARLGELTETMLEAGRVSEGKVQFTPAPFNLAALIKKLVQQQQDISPNHVLFAEIGVVPESFLGDQRRVMQIVVNLLSNAIKYSPAGGAVRVRLDTAGDAVRIAVEDHGVGIPKDELPHLFDLFFRASTAAGIPGTGVGLDMVKKFAELHGGHIVAESEIGRGSTFTVILPIRGGGDVPLSCEAGAAA